MKYAGLYVVIVVGGGLLATLFGHRFTHAWGIYGKPDLILALIACVASLSVGVWFFYNEWKKKQ